MNELKELAGIFQAFLPLLLLITIMFFLIRAAIKVRTLPPEMLKKRREAIIKESYDHDSHRGYSENDEFFMPGGVSYSDDD